MTQFIKMYDTIFSIFKYKNDTIYKKSMTWFKCKSNKMTQFIKMYDTVL